MTRRLHATGWPSLIVILAAFTAACASGADPLDAGPSSADVISGPLTLPEGSARPGFDPARLNTENYGAFEPFYVRETVPLRDALDAQRVASDTRVLVTGTAAGPVALLTDQMAYHHLAQGRDGGQDWMATF